VVSRKADSNRRAEQELRFFGHDDDIMRKTTMSEFHSERIRDLTAELRRHAPRWADRLSSATTEHELLEVVSKLFNLSSALPPARDSTVDRNDRSGEIARFISRNLHQGLTLKILAQFLGYSEKYCSDLFHSTMGEPFSQYLKRRQTDAAAALLTTTDKSLAEIASAIGFSDQFAFSHFFKRMTGRSPRDYRIAHAQRRPPQLPVPPL
jgi:AraC-like DNA-binding protein